MDEVVKKMYVELPIQVKTYDIDYMQIVHNSVYVKWFEDLRMKILDNYFPLQQMLKSNNTPILYETKIVYLKPIQLHSKPIGKAWIQDLQRSKWHAQFEITQGNSIYCHGSQTGFYYSMDKKRPISFPQEFIDLYHRL